MDLLIDFAKNVYFQCYKLKHLEPLERYEALLNTYGDFTKTYPLVVKYMCFYFAFDPDLFKQLLTQQQTTRPTYEKGFELQADYVKHLLVKRGVSKIEAKKIREQELEIILKDIYSIKKQEKLIKKQNATARKENISEIRKEMIEFIKENKDII